MALVKNALLSMPSDGSSFVYKIQVCYIMLEIRYPATPVSLNSLPLVAHYITLDQANFSNNMDIARFIMKKTKEQIMTYDYSGTYNAEHLNRIGGRPEVSYKELTEFILKILFVAIHLVLLGVSILLVVAMVSLRVCNSKPVPNWVQFLLRVQRFIKNCIYRLMQYMNIV